MASDMDDMGSRITIRLSIQVHFRGRTVSRGTASLPEPRPADRRPGGRADHHPEGRGLHSAPPPVRLRRAFGSRDDRRFIPVPTHRFLGRRGSVRADLG
jgi:hypothetical protein